jgi:hypothetical protein
MKLVNTWILLALACCWPNVAPAQLQLLPDKEPQQVFAGDARKITVVWHNAGDQPADAEIHMRIFQTSSVTVVQLGENLWKKLQVLPRQTILESAQLDFPAVKAETKFLVQWLENSNHVFGTTTVLVYPTNLLAELQPLADGKAIGVFDPQNELKPLLKNLQIDFEDLGNLELENFSGKLAIIGPFRSKTQIHAGLTEEIESLAKKGTGIVWIQPPDSSEKLQPSFYLVPKGPGTIVVTQTALVSDLPAKPQSQLNLLYFCELALNPQPPVLPDSSPQL